MPGPNSELVKTLRLGTRRSLLAWAQSSWVARELERIHNGAGSPKPSGQAQAKLKIELVGIETQGDRILDISLRKVEGKEFFVGELDQALRSNEVDFNVHSMKDLSLERPDQFCLAAVPEREDSRDVVIFSPTAQDKLGKGLPVRIGTSSPRRLENLPRYLTNVLPQFSGRKPSELQFEEIRGNVNTRLSRLHLPATDQKYLDAVVLAAAGLNRLWIDEKGRAELSTLLQGCRQMWVPLSESPSAPAQGALAIECRSDDHETLEILRKIHHPESAALVAQERAILDEKGGGCHQRFGASAIEFCGTNSVKQRMLWIRGRSSNGAELNELRWSTPQRPDSAAAFEIRTRADERQVLPLTLVMRQQIERASWIVVAHAAAVTADILPLLKDKNCIVMGQSSAERLAGLGLWVALSAEGMGFESISPLLGRPRFLDHLRSPVGPASRLVGEKSEGRPAELVVLTHETALPDWLAQSDSIAGVSIRPLATYRMSGRGRLNLDRLKKLSGSNVTACLYWSSGSSFSEYIDEIDSLGCRLLHCCGPGKTSRRIREAGIEPKVFPTRRAWADWIGEEVCIL